MLLLFSWSPILLVCSVLLANVIVMIAIVSDVVLANSDTHDIIGTAPIVGCLFALLLPLLLVCVRCSLLLL